MHSLKVRVIVFGVHSSPTIFLSNAQTSAGRSILTTALFAGLLVSFRLFQGFDDMAEFLSGIFGTSFLCGTQLSPGRIPAGPCLMDRHAFCVLALKVFHQNSERNVLR